MSVMSTAIAASVVWLVVVAWLTDALAARRQALAAAETRLRLYQDTVAQQHRRADADRMTIRLTRDARDESDRQVRVLLGQVDHLARQVIDLAADAECAPVVTLPSHRHPALRES